MKRTTRTRAGAQRSAAARRPSAGSGMGGKLLIMAALVAAVVFGVAIFFKVGRIEVQGNTIYASDKIIEASGLELGDNLLTVSRATVGGNVKAALPYVDQVSVGRVLPDTVVISVKESQLAFAAATDTNTVWLISPSGKALERIDASLQEQYPQIIGVTLNNPTAGQTVTAVNQSALDAVLSLFSELDGTGIQIFPVSAATNPNFRELLYATVRMLDQCPPAEPFSEEELAELSDFESEPFTVEVEDGAYFVSGREMDRLIASVNFDSEDSLNFFHRSLRRMGVIDALREKGAQEGDTVVIGEMEFEYER